MVSGIGVRLGAMGELSQVVDPVLFLDDPLQIARRIGMRLAHAKRVGGQLGAEPAVGGMSSEVDELRHQHPPVVISSPQKVYGLLDRVLRGPWDRHELVFVRGKGYVFYADAPLLADGGDTGMGFSREGRLITGKQFTMREL